jgi:hypothetical protein
LSRVSAYDWMGSMALRPLGLAIVGPIAAAIGFKATLLGAFGLTMASSTVLLLIPDMWRITASTPATEPGVILDETIGVDVEAG